jgi:hypothetical protein
MPLFGFISRELPPRNFAVLAIQEIQTFTNIELVSQLSISQAEKQQEEGAGVGA